MALNKTAYIGIIITSVILLLASMLMPVRYISAQDGTLEISKTAYPDTIHTGDTVTYTIIVTNNTTNHLTVDIQDETFGQVATNVPLDEGASVTYSFTDNPLSDVSSTVAVIGNVTFSDIQIPPLLASATSTVDVLNPSIEVSKFASPASINEGETTVFSITVTNTGDAVLSVDVADEALGPIESGVIMEPGFSLTWDITDTPTSSYTNTAVATGSDSIGGIVTDSAIASVEVNSTDSIAFIYGTDESSTASFLSLLDDNGYLVEPIDIDEVATTNLSVHELIIVASDTGYDYNWGNDSAIEVIAESGLPILGMGYGGSCLFQQLGLSINWGNGWLGSETSLFVSEPGHTIYNAPRPIAIPDDSNIILYSSSEHIGEYAPVLDTGVILLGREPSDEDHYPLVQEGLCLLWGFTGAPDRMTDTGRDLFLNVVDYLQGFIGLGLPDLIITDIWNDDGVISYQAMNIGDVSTPSGHTTALLVDGELVSVDIIDEILESGERIYQSFDYEWLVTPPDDIITVTADHSNVVAEIAESNNQRIETWVGDNLAPSIISGPSISGVTETSAVVTWETDEAGDSTMHYGTISGIYDRQEQDPALVTSHSFTLLDLVPATTYAAVVETADTFGNTVISDALTFQTLPLPDASPPSLAIIDSGIWRLDEPVGVDAIDDSQISKVEFYIDGVLVFTDYSAPFQYYANTGQYADGQHDLTTKAFDLAGNVSTQQQQVGVANLKDQTAPTVSISTPAAEATISGKTYVTVSLGDDTGLLKATLRIDGQWWGDWFPPKPNTTQATANFTWDTTSLSNGQYRAAVEVYDDDIKYAVDYVDVYVNNTPPPPPPNLVVTRSVSRIQNYFEIELKVKNTGGETATDVKLRDVLQLFQPISAENAIAEYEASYEPDLTSWRMDIDSKVDIAAGQERTFGYFAVPVMTYPAGLTAMIGGDNYGPSTRIWYESTTTIQNYYKDIDLLFLPYAGYPSALETSDYLIVTSPQNLFRLNSESDVNDLLSTMAELAKLKNGVLGYLEVPAIFPRAFDPHDAFTAGDVLSDTKDEVIIGDISNGRICVEGIPSVTYNYGPGATFRSPWRELANIKCGYMDQGYAAGDGLTVGQFVGLAKQQIVMADASADKFFVYDGDGWRQGNFYGDADPAVPFTHIDIEPYDGLAAGDVNGDGGDELVFADRSANEMRVFRITGVYKNESFNISHPLLEIANFSSNFEAHDGIAVGDVTGDNKEEIIMADRSADKVYIMSYTGNLLGQFSVKFDEGYALATGRAVYTWPNDKEEIVITDLAQDRVWVYRGDGLKVTGFKHDLSTWDHLAVGSVAGGTNDEVIIAGVSDDFLHFRDPWSSMGDEHVLANLIKAKQDTGLLTITAPVADGAWSKKLKSDWVTNGYLLIVGETDIIPAYKGEYLGSVLLTTGKTSLMADVTDYPYASTYGELIKPELALGRIVGNSASELKNVIDVSINVAKGTPGFGFDRSFSLAVSGFSKGVSGGADNIDFKSEALKVALTMKNTGINGVVMFTPTYAVYKSDGSIDQNATETAGAQKFFSVSSGNDVIFLTGHGGGSHWDVIGQDDVLLQADPFGNTNPFVFASSCYTGEFTHAMSIANAFLNREAALYLGATKWGLGTHAGISPLVFYMWDPGESIAMAVKQVKRNIGDIIIGSSTGTYIYPDKRERYWSAIYHVLGDPKFGTEGPPTSTLNSQSQGLTTSPVVDISVPTYEILQSDGQDNVSIPGGNLIAMPGLPAVPYYQVSYEYPKSYQIQDVTLENRSVPEVITGLNIPTIVESVGASEEQVQLPPELQNVDWWPQDGFSWSIIDGLESNTLVITVFPFAYNQLTTDARFYHNYSFAIDYEISTVEIKGLSTNQRVYNIGDDVTVNIEFGDGETGEVPPEGRTIVVSGRVYRNGSDDLVGGLPVRIFDNFHGIAACAEQWNSAGQEPGLYYVEVQILAPDGTLLSSMIQNFILGAVQGEIADLSASPQYFSPGEEVSLSLTFNNTGIESVSGTGIISLLSESGETIEVFEHDFSNLTPGDALTFQNTWDTHNAGGIYNAVGVVEYGPYAAGPVGLILSSNIPNADAGADQVVERTSPSGAEVILDGSKSSDPQNDPLDYEWTWTGGSATGVSPTIILPPGMTTVTLTVADAQSSDTDTVSITVIDTIGPAIQIEIPQPGDALQDGVMFRAATADPSGVDGVYFYLRQPGGINGLPIGEESLTAILNDGSAESGIWSYEFDTTNLPDGSYLLLARAVDNYGNQNWTSITTFSIHNWALMDLLPASKVNRAGRTMPIKFTIKVNPDIDNSEPFVYNDELEIMVFVASDLSTPLQISTFGERSSDYRIDLDNEIYITNFKTSKTPENYVVQVRRISTGDLIGEFTFYTTR
jgi:hypothetical protein